MEAQSKARLAQKEAQSAAFLASRGIGQHRRDRNEQGVYLGQWNGTREGAGVIELSRGDLYEGQWRNGKFNGFAVYTFRENGRIVGDYYEGEFADDAPNGVGVYTWRDGSSGYGAQRNGRRVGLGTLELSTGARYEGEFFDDLGHGLGVWWHADGTVKEAGRFTRGRLTEQLSVGR